MTKRRNSYGTRANGPAKGKYNASQLLDFAQDSYLERTSRPIYAIVFLLPFIVFYEVCVLFIRTDVLNQSPILVDTFVWLQKFLGSLGFGGKLAWAAPPLVVIVILLALQITSGKRWRFWLNDVWRMAVECVLLAVPLVVLVLFINSLSQSQRNAARFEDTSTASRNSIVTSCSVVTEDSLSAVSNNSGGSMSWRYWIANIASGIGAGIYEELIFRLILICVLMMLFQDVLGLNHKNSIILSVLISAALFSAHHHIDFLSGEPNQRDIFNLTKFIFRAIAGVYFAGLFAIRGFGIAAGTHAFYNIIAVSINARFFQ